MDRVATPERSQIRDKAIMASSLFRQRRRTCQVLNVSPSSTSWVFGCGGAAGMGDGGALLGRSNGRRAKFRFSGDLKLPTLQSFHPLRNRSVFGRPAIRTKTLSNAKRGVAERAISSSPAAMNQNNPVVCPPLEHELARSDRRPLGPVDREGLRRRPAAR